LGTNFIVGADVLILILLVLLGAFIAGRIFGGKIFEKLKLLV
jgi:hypothetical protein